MVAEVLVVTVVAVAIGLVALVEAPRSEVHPEALAEAVLAASVEVHLAVEVRAEVGKFYVFNAISLAIFL